MTVNEIMSALALRLGELFPERAVYYTPVSYTHLTLPTT